MLAASPSMLFDVIARSTTVIAQLTTEIAQSTTVIAHLTTGIAQSKLWTVILRVYVTH